MLNIIYNTAEYVGHIIYLLVPVFLCCDFHPRVVFVVHNLEQVDLLQLPMDFLQHFLVLFIFAFLLELHVFYSIKGLRNTDIDIMDP